LFEAWAEANFRFRSPWLF